MSVNGCRHDDVAASSSASCKCVDAVLLQPLWLVKKEGRLSSVDRAVKAQTRPRNWQLQSCNDLQTAGFGGGARHGTATMLLPWLACYTLVGVRSETSWFERDGDWSSELFHPKT